MVRSQSITSQNPKVTDVAFRACTHRCHPATPYPGNLRVRQHVGAELAGERAALPNPAVLSRHGVLCVKRGQHLSGAGAGAGARGGAVSEGAGAGAGAREGNRKIFIGVLPREQAGLADVCGCTSRDKTVTTDSPQAAPSAICLVTPRGFRV